MSEAVTENNESCPAFQFVMFNGMLGDTRRVFLADFGPLLG